MTRLLPIALLWALPLAACGGDNHEKVFQDNLEVLDEFADVLADIEDMRSATANKVRLQEVVEKIRVMDARIKKLGKPDAATEKELQNRYEPEMEKALRRLAQETMRIAQDPELVAQIRPAMVEVQAMGH